jgi:hypothetical protein
MGVLMRYMGIIDTRLQAVIKKCTEMGKEQRYKTINEVLQYFEIGALLIKFNVSDWYHFEGIVIHLYPYRIISSGLIRAHATARRY